MNQLLDGSLSPDLALDLLIAIENTSFEKLKAKKNRYESGKDSKDPLAIFREALHGRKRQ